MRWLSFLWIPLMACTGVMVRTEGQQAVSGRTLEFGVEVDPSVAVIPRNFEFVGKAPQGKGLVYKSKYAAVGAYCFADVVLMDGMNEKGLVAGAFYFPGYAKYSEVTAENQARALSPADFPNWVLTQFATLDEVKQALSSIVLAPTALEGWGPTPPPMHYIVYDASGKSIVIEPVDGKLKVYDNPLGVMANSPSFDWHLTNLNNYINLSVVNADPSFLGALALHPFGQGTGLLGLPGDFTPPSRFVRAAFFATGAVPVNTSDAAVDQVFHILNQFDIPLGAVQEKRGAAIYDYTMLTSVKNAETLEYFYRSYQNQNIQYVSLQQFDLNAKSIKTMKITGQQKKYNISSMLR